MTELIELGQFFTKRGEIRKTINVLNTKIEITIIRFTNKENDDLASEFLTLAGDTVEIDAPGLLDARIMKGLIDMNFDFGGRSWKDLSEDEKRGYMDTMHPKLREAISNEIAGENTISEEEKGFLLKLS